MEEYKRFRELVGILFATSCENYDHVPHTDGYQMQKNLKKYLEQFGVEVTLQEYKKENGTVHANLIAKNKVDNGKYIALQGHIDTVPCNEKYFYKLTDKEIIGRGAVDMKGPVIGAILAFLNIVEAKERNVMLIVTDDEETDFQGVNELIREKKKYLSEVEMVVNVEPTNLKPAFLNRGYMSYKFQAIGFNGHSSSFYNDFLIERSEELFVACNKFLKEVRKVKSKKLGTTVGAFTIFNSGTKSNQLPSALEMVFNLRTVTDKKVYEKLFKKIVMPKIPKSYKYKTYALDSFDSSITKETKEKLKNAFKASKAKYQESIMNAMTELFMFENAKIPGFIFGPGDMNLAHVRPSDERIKVKDILKFSEVLTNFLKN